MNNVNELVCLNIRYLARKKGLKIGQLESMLNVRVGYFSRKVRSDSSVNFETVYKAAQILDVSIDELCSNRFIDEISDLVSEFGYKLVKED